VEASFKRRREISASINVGNCLSNGEIVGPRERPYSMEFAVS
jgi:hypothetical protein